MKRTTIKDVAREAGVSISTVSNALNNSGVISEKTRALVLEVAERLHYIPNRSGQSLRVQEKKAIGLFLHELRGAYYGALADTLHHECRKRGYELYIFITHDDNTILQKTIGGDVSAAVLFCCFMSGLLFKTPAELCRQQRRYVQVLGRPGRRILQGVPQFEPHRQAEPARRPHSGSGAAARFGRRQGPFG